MEKQTASNQKTTQQSKPTPARSAAGPGGMAVIPPAYGMDLVDQGFGITPSLVLQTKLTINQPGDIYEREADQVADQIMRMPQPQVQRRCACGGTPGPDGECEACKHNRLALQRKESNSDQAMAAPPIVNEVLSSPGRSLDSTTRNFMESRFGHDFSNVKVHTGAKAAESAQAVNAKAYAVGSDVVFASGSYSPQTIEGKKLLAHELTHVVQQSGGVHRSFTQEESADEVPKYAVIDYKKARQNNLQSWHDQYKFYDLFHEERIYPGSNPIAYANHTYDLQLRLEEIFERKWKAPEPGILEPIITADSTVTKLSMVAQKNHDDPSVNKGISRAKLERFYKYFGAFDQRAPAFVTKYFIGVPQLEAVNRNKYFYIRIGDKGEYVKRIQLALLDLGYDLGRDLKTSKKTNMEMVSGVFGRDTRQAVIKFQKDSGLEGKDIDGIVGQVTLRLLDKHTNAPAFQRESIAAGTAYSFHIPVNASDLLLTETDLKKELLKRTLKVGFPVTDKEIDVLMRSDLHYEIYRKLTQSDVDLGYATVEIGISLYKSIMAKAEQVKGRKDGMPVEEKLTGITLDVLKTSKLAELNEKIDKAERELQILALYRAGYGSIKQKRDELDQLKQERQVELNRLGLTLDEYENLKTDFIETFERFAVQTAFQMLAENEIQANIEARHYGNMNEVVAIKSILSDLAIKYGASEKLWWEAVSQAETQGRETNLYKNNDDYKRINTITGVTEGHYRSSEFIGNSSHFYNEKNVSEMYKALEKAPSPYFALWKEKEKEVVTTLQEKTDKFPILAYPKLELRREAWGYAKKSDEDLQKMLLGIILGTNDDKGIKQNIEATRKDLAEDPEKIWELPVVVQQAQQALGVTEGPPADLIKAKQKAVADKGFWKSIGLAILGIGLGLLALMSGPVGWLALGASIAVGAYDAYRTYQDISFRKETAGSAIDPASALGTDDPSYFWFWVSLVSVGIDVLQAAKVIKSVAKGIELAEDVTKGLNEAKAAAKLRLAEAGGSATAKGKQILREIEEIDQALSKVDPIKFGENYKLLKPLQSNPIAVTVMSEALRDKKIVRAVMDLGKLVEKEMFENVLRFYAGVGRKSLDELPELMRLIKEGGLDANKRLMTELLSDPRTQRALLDSQDPKLIAKEFDAWEAAVKAGKSQSFVKYLEAENLTTKLVHDVKLVDLYGEAFAALPNAVKNRQILRTVEPRLLQALNDGALSPAMTRTLEMLLNSDVLAESTRLASAQERLLRELRILGGLVETPDDFSKVISLLESPSARRALWEGAGRLSGKDNYVELIIKANGGKLPAADVMDDLIRIGPMKDEATIQSLLGNSNLRKALEAYPEAVAVLKRCGSPCLPPFVTPEQVEQVAKLMVGKSNDDMRRIREFLYLNRSSEDTFKSALKSLETNLGEALKDVKIQVLKVPSKLGVADETLRAIEALGMRVEDLNNIMAKAATVGNGEAIITDLYRVMQLADNVKLQNFDKLIQGLAKGNPAEFRAARHLLDQAAEITNAADGFRYAGLQKGDVLLGRFTLTELDALMRARWIPTKETRGVVITLYDLATKMGGEPGSRIVDLVVKAGGGKSPGNLGRLSEILAFMKSPSVTYEEAVKAIEAADAFASNVARAMRDPKTGYAALAKLIWGESVKVEEDVIKATEAIGKSGSDAYTAVFRLGKGDSIAKEIAGGSAISKEKWKVFRQVIEKSDIAQGIKNNILGEMWTRVHVQQYRALGYQVFREVPITNGKVLAKADLVLIRGREFIVVECKAGGGVYSEGQEVIYKILGEKDGFKSVVVTGDKALVDKFAEPESLKKFLPIREDQIIP